MTSCTHLGNDGDPGPEPAQPQLGDVNAVNGDGAAGSLDYPLQTVLTNTAQSQTNVFATEYLRETRAHMLNFHCAESDSALTNMERSRNFRT